MKKCLKCGTIENLVVSKNRWGKYIKNICYSCNSAEMSRRVKINHWSASNKRNEICSNMSKKMLKDYKEGKRDKKHIWDAGRKKAKELGRIPFLTKDGVRISWTDDKNS